MRRTGFLVALLLWGACSLPPEAEENSRDDFDPNVIYILADDLGYGDLGSYGQERIRTPHLDRMAEEGIRFSQHYAGSTVCAPSRCSLMTGMHTGHASVRGNVRSLMRPAEVTVAEIMGRAGYTTACIGKWGIGYPPPPTDPRDNGFEYFFGYLSMWHAHNSYPEFLWRNGQRVPLGNVVEHPQEYYLQSEADLVGHATRKVDYSQDLFTEEALDFLDRKPESFFLYLAYTVPHANNEATRFGAPGMEVPELGEYSSRDWPDIEKRKAAQITRLDSYVGSILEKLRETAMDRRTLVIFTSDNGPHREGGVDPEFFNSNGALRGIKRDLYEGGIRVPMIARWPGRIEAGRESDHVSAFWDVLPTLAELVRSEAPPTDGLSFLPELMGEEQAQHEYLYWEFHEGSSKQALRIEDWKGVRLAPGSPLQLYDLSRDLGETSDISGDHPEMVVRMERLLEEARNGEEAWPLVTAR